MRKILIETMAWRLQTDFKSRSKVNVEISVRDYMSIVDKEQLCFISCKQSEAAENTL